MRGLIGSRQPLAWEASEVWGDQKKKPVVRESGREVCQGEVPPRFRGISLVMADPGQKGEICKTQFDSRH